MAMVMYCFGLHYRFVLLPESKYSCTSVPDVSSGPFRRVGWAPVVDHRVHLPTRPVTRRSEPVLFRPVAVNSPLLPCQITATVRYMAVASIKLRCHNDAARTGEASHRPGDKTEHPPTVSGHIDIWL